MLLFLLVWLACVLACDLRHRRVPNALVLIGAGLAVVALATTKQPLEVGWGAALIASGAGFFVLLVFYLQGLMGAADVKFAAALGLWIGPWALLGVWVGASLLAGLHALALLAWRHQRGLSRVGKREIPYAAHMAAVTMGGVLWRLHAH